MKAELCYSKDANGERGVLSRAGLTRIDRKGERMSIKIETRKEVNGNGLAGRRILSVEALGWDALPSLYLDQKQACWKSGSELRGKEGMFLWPDRFLAETDFQEILERVKVAGNLLRDVNTKLTSLREEWNGEETFVI